MPLQSGFYASIGAAQVFVEQNTSDFYVSSDINRIEARTGTLFIDHGRHASIISNVSLGMVLTF